MHTYFTSRWLYFYRKVALILLYLVYITFQIEKILSIWCMVRNKNTLPPRWYVERKKFNIENSLIWFVKKELALVMAAGCMMWLLCLFVQINVGQLFHWQKQTIIIKSSEISPKSIKVCWNYLVYAILWFQKFAMQALVIIFSITLSFSVLWTIFSTWFFVKHNFNLKILHRNHILNYIRT